MGRRVIVVGGGAGGPSAAAKAKRVDASLDVQMFESGPHVSYAACPTPYYICDMIKDPNRIIARTPEQFEKSGVHVHVNHSIEELDMDGGFVRDSENRKWPFDVLVYAAGASPFLPSIPGIGSEGVFTLKNLRDAMNIKNFIEEKKARSAVILGAGFIAMEMAESFRERGIETTILYRGELPVKQMGPDISKIILEELEKHGVRFVTGAEPTAIVQENGGLIVETAGERFSADIVLAALGIRPNTRLAQSAGLRLGDAGGVLTDASSRTNLENVYAAGDCTEVFHLVSRRPAFLPLGDTANKQGRVAGSNIGGEAAVFPGVVGSWCFKMFDLEVAATGLTESGALKAGFHPVSTIIKANSRAGSYPGGKPVTVQIQAERSTGKLLGAQFIGAEGAVSRSNVVAACLYAGMSVEDLAFMDLCYAPPYSPVWDALHIAAQECLKKI